MSEQHEYINEIDIPIFEDADALEACVLSKDITAVVYDTRLGMTVGNLSDVDRACLKAEGGKDEV